MSDHRYRNAQPSLPSRRRFLRGMIGCAAALGASSTIAACARFKTGSRDSLTGASGRQEASQALRPTPELLPASDGSWTPDLERIGDLPAGQGTIDVEGIGKLAFDAGDLETLRPDVFQPGHCSLFDALAHLGSAGAIDLAYHFDETMDTHVIDSINGRRNWRYEAHYSASWYESNVMRMDMSRTRTGRRCE